MKQKNTPMWLWYPGDFEIYHALLQNLDRVERGFQWPAFWHLDDCNKQVHFSRTYNLDAETEFTVSSNAKGYVDVNWKKYPLGQTITCGPGIVKIEIFAALLSGVPSIYIEGEIICSDEGWMADDQVSDPVLAGHSPYYTKKTQNPSIWEYSSELVRPQQVTEYPEGTLYDFGRELTAVVLPSYPGGFRPLLVAYGESETEARDTQNCYYSESVSEEGQAIPKHAFRYLFLPGCKPGEVELEARHEFTDIPVRASFQCGDELLNQIWSACCETYRLCSGTFFIDGIKRDRWLWSGDAYQNYLVNPYLFSDREITKRTILGLRGNDPVQQHVNTILDYSMYWIISIANYYQSTADEAFVRMVYPKMKTMMAFLESQLDENGFIIGRSGDWIFVDWSEMDKTGALCAEQMLFVMCYRTMAQMQALTGDGQEDYAAKENELLKKIEAFFWDEEKKAYIDSFSSGKRHVTRHANLFAILFGIADETRCGQIYESVIANDTITQITTPYFKFYELEALCRLGKKQEVLQRMKEYWGAILAEGTGTIWEEYDPKQTGPEKYSMYNDPYGKSLCHAWGASPIYLLGRYFLGVEPTSPGYGSFRAEPETELLGSFDCVVPVEEGTLHLVCDGKELSATADRNGGTLVYQGNEYTLETGKTVTVELI